MTSNTATTAQIGTALQQDPAEAFLTLHALQEQLRTERTDASLYRGDYDEADRIWAAMQDAANATRDICTEFDSPLTVGACHTATFAYYYKSDRGQWVTWTPARSDQYGLVFVKRAHGTDFHAMRAALRLDGTRIVKAPADLPTY
ncbi:hypothetical protein [Brachybacterium tyrofermentans]|uniref:hypothetical protein n=1 Tax=Brachybacterium tyrofermentans TaxID=47848 RepID=UPI001867A66B|nr:hypothetical protein [Brachybacterium tyrofermentans]